MYRVILDSNIYLSALVFGGNPRTIVELAERGLFEVFAASAIQTEVERVLSLKFHWPNERIGMATARLWALAQFIQPKHQVADCEDPDDNRVLECALQANAQAIVTGDNHLLKLHPYRKILILTPRDFLGAKPWQL